MIKSNTNCEKCIFSDYADAPDPCKMNIIEKIKPNHQIEVKNKYNYIIDYKCKYGFDLETYKKYQNDIGSINELENQIKIKNYIKYFLIVNLHDLSTEYIENICNDINNLSIPPAFVSIYIFQNNDTDKIISILESKIDKNIKWRIHNFLFSQETYEYINSIITTNYKKNESFYIWINDSNSSVDWNKNISKINSIINIDQPPTQALIRNKLDWDGLFLTFDNYADLAKQVNDNIIIALDSLENKNFINYD